MNRFIKKWFFPSFLLFVIMAEGIFYAYMAFTGASEVSGKMQYMFIGIFGISMLIMFRDLNSKSKGYREKRLLAILALISLLYIASSLFVPIVPENYKTYLLVFGSKSIPACIIGMHLARVPSHTLKRVDILIPIFVVPIGMIIGLVGFRAAVASEIVREGGDDFGLNYQILSYFMAEYYAYSAYYLFFSTARNSRLFRVTKYIMFVAMLFFASICTVGGGRGAFVFMVLITLFIFYQMIHSNRLKKSQALLIVFFFVLCFGIIASKFNLLESAGFVRVVDHISEDDARMGLYRLALDSFWKSPIIGHGIGSVWWEVGFYSHNMLLDVLVEGGIIGLFILIIVAFKTYERMFVLCRYDSSYLFLMIMLLKVSLNGMFSGYYLDLYQIWLIVGLIFVRPSSYYRQIRHYNSIVRSRRHRNAANKHKNPSCVFSTFRGQN